MRGPRVRSPPRSPPSEPVRPARFPAKRGGKSDWLIFVDCHMRSSMRNRLIGLLTLLLTLQPPPIAGATLAGVTFPDRIDIDGHSLVLNGLGVRKKLFIKVYVGALYLPQKEASAPNVLGAD